MLLMMAVIVVPIVVVAIGSKVRSRVANFILAPVLGAGLAIAWGVTLSVDEVAGNIGFIISSVAMYVLMEFARQADPIDVKGTLAQKRVGSVKRSEVKRRLSRQYSVEVERV